MDRSDIFVYHQSGVALDILHRVLRVNRSHFDRRVNVTILMKNVSNPVFFSSISGFSRFVINSDLR